MRLSYSVLASALVVFGLGLATPVEAKSKNQARTFTSAGQQDLPECLDGDRRAIQGNNNEEVLRWKEETANQFQDRALIDGVLVGVLLDRNSHLHLEVDIGDTSNGDDRSENLEIVYNKSFGAVGEFEVGARVQACGDYITSTKQSGPYKPSPVGAILHWVHKSNTPERHPHGFLAIDGKVYGKADEKGFRQNRPNHFSRR